MSVKKEEVEELLFMSDFGPISNAKLHDTFDVLPNLIDVLKDIQSAASHQETTRIGDISTSVRQDPPCGVFARDNHWVPKRPIIYHYSMCPSLPPFAQAVAVKQKYAEALELLRALPGTDTSLEEQEAAIEDAKKELKRISDQVELFSHTLYRGTDEPRAEINDAFSRKSL